MLRGATGRQPLFRGPSFRAFPLCVLQPFPYGGLFLLYRFSLNRISGSPVSHNEIFPIVRLMMKAIPSRLHLFPGRICNTEAPSGGMNPLLGRHKFRQGSHGFFDPFRFQKLRHLCETKAVTIMGGIFAVLMQHHNIRYGQGMAVEVCRTVNIEPGINAFQAVMIRHRGSIDQVIIRRINRKTVSSDGIQRLKAVVQSLISAL